MHLDGEDAGLDGSSVITALTKPAGRDIHTTACILCQSQTDERLESLPAPGCGLSANEGECGDAGTNKRRLMTGVEGAFCVMLEAELLRESEPAAPAMGEGYMSVSTTEDVAVTCRV